MAYKQETVMPYGTRTEKRKQVERMFDNIAPSYDCLNHVFSFGIDKLWRKRSIDALKPFHHTDILDVATGTGDYALLAARRLRPQKIVAVDLSEGMMNIGREKVKRAGMDGIISFRKEDCEHLSFEDGTFDAVISAYGVRNFQNLDACLQEMRRVLRPEGHLLILELATPPHFPMKQLFHLYSHTLMTFVGRRMSHDRRAYSYLPATMEAFPQGEVMQKIIEKAGYSKVSFHRFTFGLSTMYVAEK